MEVEGGGGEACESDGEEVSNPQRESEDSVDMGVDIEFNEGEHVEEALAPVVLRDPGAPTTAEVELHNATHLPFRSWCPSCVSGKAREKYTSS